MKKTMRRKTHKRRQFRKTTKTHKNKKQGWFVGGKILEKYKTAFIPSFINIYNDNETDPLKNPKNHKYYIALLADNQDKKQFFERKNDPEEEHDTLISKEPVAGLMVKVPVGKNGETENLKELQNGLIQSPLEYNVNPTNIAEIKQNKTHYPALIMSGKIDEPIKRLTMDLIQNPPKTQNSTTHVLTDKHLVRTINRFL